MDSRGELLLDGVPCTFKAKAALRRKMSATTISLFLDLSSSSTSRSIKPASSPPLPLSQAPSLGLETILQVAGSTTLICRSTSRHYLLHGGNQLSANNAVRESSSRREPVRPLGSCRRHGTRNCRQLSARIFAYDHWFEALVCHQQGVAWCVQLPKLKLRYTFT